MCLLSRLGVAVLNVEEDGQRDSLSKKLQAEDNRWPHSFVFFSRFALDCNHLLAVNRDPNVDCRPKEEGEGKDRAAENDALDWGLFHVPKLLTEESILAVREVAQEEKRKHKRDGKESAGP